MSTISQQSQALQYVASQIHTGSPAESEVLASVSALFAATSATVDAPAVSYDFEHTSVDQVFNLKIIKKSTTVNFSAGSNLPVGSTVAIDVVQGGTGYDLVIGTNGVGQGITGVANDRDVIVLKYDGSSWIQISTEKAVDAA